MNLSLAESWRSPWRRCCCSLHVGIPTWQWLLLAGLSLLLYLFCLGGSRTLTNHEVYVAGPAKQMVQDGDYLIPRMGHHTWLEKPPLPHWLIVASAWLCGGFTNFSARLPMALAGVGVVLVATGLSARLFGPTVGFLSGLLLATSAFMLNAARQSIADMILELIVVSAVAIFVRVHFGEAACTPRAPPTDEAGTFQTGGDRPPGLTRAVMLFWVLIGLTNLAKGPFFGGCLALVTCGGWLMVSWQWNQWRLWLSPWGLLLAATIGILWPAAALVQYPETWELWRQHLFGRLSGASLEIFQRPFWYYLPCPFWQWLPWTPLILMAGWASLRKAWRAPRSPHRFVWWWFLGQAALLSCSAGKNHLYLIYALPALAPVAALGLLGLGSRVSAGARWLSRLSWMACGAPLIGATAIAGIALYAPHCLVDALLMGALASSCALAIGLLVLRRRAVGAGSMTLALVVICELYILGSVMRYRDTNRADREFLGAVKLELAPDDLLYSADWSGTPRFIFYLDHPVVGYWYPHEIPELSSDRTHAYVLARAGTATDLARLGHVAVVSQSAHTRNERGPEDRFTLFRVERELVEAPAQVARLPR